MMSENSNIGKRDKEAIDISDAVELNSLNELKYINSNSLILIELTQTQIRLNAIHTLSEARDTNILFCDCKYYGYRTAILYHDLIVMLKRFNKNMGFEAEELCFKREYDNENACYEYVQTCIHELTGMKPKLIEDSNDQLHFWR